MLDDRRRHSPRGRGWVTTPGNIHNHLDGLERFDMSKICVRICRRTDRFLQMPCDESSNFRILTPTYPRLGMTFFFSKQASTYASPVGWSHSVSRYCHPFFDVPYARDHCCPAAGFPPPRRHGPRSHGLAARSQGRRNLLFLATGISSTCFLLSSFPSWFLFLFRSDAVTDAIDASLLLDLIFFVSCIFYLPFAHFFWCPGG
ncbi:hypothetical protein QBC35DRAFT_46734 [Podospora australis]|uniref:Transmembrane protein n=1 Tax=Podospora australis TaxID=1536484 RepID=A0AAN7ADM2_9PEZI|nr:hypothetical protein QBC35DRAFT_46734 [Podospora australis]